jgi:hypothetical protein
LLPTTRGRRCTPSWAIQPAAMMRHAINSFSSDSLRGYDREWGKEGVSAGPVSGNADSNLRRRSHRATSRGSAGAGNRHSREPREYRDNDEEVVGLVVHHVGQRPLLELRPRLRG